MSFGPQKTSWSNIKLTSALGGIVGKQKSNWGKGSSNPNSFDHGLGSYPKIRWLDPPDFLKTLVVWHVVWMNPVTEFVPQKAEVFDGKTRGGWNLHRWQLRVRVGFGFASGKKKRRKRRDRRHVSMFLFPRNKRSEMRKRQICIFERKATLKKK